MMSHALKKWGWGYVKIDKDLWVRGEIVETDASGAAGYFALLKTETPFTTFKTLVHSIGQLRRNPPKKGRIIGLTEFVNS